MTTSRRIAALTLAGALFLLAPLGAATTSLGGLWFAGCPKGSDSVKNKKKVLDRLDYVRVAVEYKNLDQENPPLAFSSFDRLGWRLGDHLQATGDTPTWLTVLFEPPGADDGRGFKRGPWARPPPAEILERAERWLATGRIAVLELGNEFGVVSTGAIELDAALGATWVSERGTPPPPSFSSLPGASPGGALSAPASEEARLEYVRSLYEWAAAEDVLVRKANDRQERFEWMLGALEAVVPALGESHPGVQVVAGGLSDLSDQRGLNAFIVARGSDQLRRSVLLDLHTFDVAENVRASIRQFRAAGWEPTIGEEFAQRPDPDAPGKVITEFGRLGTVRVAVEEGVQHVTVFASWGEQRWGHTLHAETSRLGVTGPTCGYDRANLALLIQMRAIVDDGTTEPEDPEPEPEPETARDRLSRLHADLGVALAECAASPECPVCPGCPAEGAWWVGYQAWAEALRYQVALGFVPGRGWRADAIRGGRHVSIAPVRDRSLEQLIGMVDRGEWE